MVPGPIVSGPRGRVLPADSHLHSQFSYDAWGRGDMEQSCHRAVQLGLPAVAFTEHVDFVSWGPADRIGDLAEHRLAHRSFAPFDPEPYLDELERCRDLFPDLRILTGMEAGEPHLFGASLADLMRTFTPDRVLGSLHAIVFDTTLRYAHHGMDALGPHEVMRRYLVELLTMIRESDVFEILAHIDFPRRYWPREIPYQETDFEEELRAVLTELAGQGRVLEVNTKSPPASARLLGWWYEVGGGAVSFGSDAHHPYGVGDRFEVAVDLVESVGFRPGRDHLDFWRR